MRLHDFFDYWSREQPDAEFGVAGEAKLSYGDAARVANRMANALIGAGCGKGDRVAVLSRNRLWFPLLYFAAAKAGVVLVPVNWRLAPAEWLAILNDAEPSALVASREYLDAVDEMRSDLTATRRFVGEEAGARPGWDDLEQWWGESPATPPDVDVRGADAVYQMYTSGTTGLPKGAVLTHESVTSNVAQVAVAGALAPGDRGLVVLPMFHAAIIPTTLTVLARGGSIYVLEDFAPDEMVRVLSEEGIVTATLVPAMLQACLVGVPDLRARRYESLRTIYYGASPIAEDTLRGAMEAFDCGFVQSYGMTEASQALTLLSAADHTRALRDRPELLLSAGRPVAGTVIKVFDDEDKPVSDHRLGEIVARGPQVMSGYSRRPEETVETLRGGWLHTGDVGRLDEEGYLFVEDRVKDMIVSGGENVYPRTVENILFEHPAIADAAVISVPDDRWGETVKAVVALRPGTTSSEEEIIEFCRTRLGGFERPRSVDFVDALPRNPTGKVLKRVLREPYWAGRARRVSGS